ncbi:MAG: response regulator [Saprospiraceae bacterium]|nr:response regulator [Saprospiraceae bacterium]
MNLNNLLIDEIVLIDDDNIVTTVNKHIIRKVIPDISIKSFENGEAGLVYLISVQDLLRKTLVFLDLDMPIMDGFKFLSIYENALAYQDHSFVICLLTSSEDKKDKIKALQYPSVLEFAQKPLSEKKIKGILERAAAVLAR